MRQAPAPTTTSCSTRHFITGDGRGNENIGLTAVHHVFHSEHNRLVDLIKNLVFGEANDCRCVQRYEPTPPTKLAFLNEWLAIDLTLATLAAATHRHAWTGTASACSRPPSSRTEMQYQHLVFEEFARTIQPNVDLSSTTTTASSTRRSSPSSPTPSIASATRC